jgi:hypothetical protein
MNLDHASIECEGLCESPVDFPARWAAMIHGYFDESGKGGYYVVAGFVGRKSDWKKFVPLWLEALGDSGPLHIKTMRLGSKYARQRSGSLLERLGAVPKQANLRAFAGVVKTSDYRHRVKGTIVDIQMTGYSVALTAMIDAILESKLIPKRDRIEFNFEEHVEYAVPRAKALKSWREIPKYRTHHGKSRIGKDSSMEKGTLLEASDYLAYAVIQHLIDETSQQAELTSPILRENKPINVTELNKENADTLIQFAIDHHGGHLPAMDREMRAVMIERMKAEVNGRNSR